MAKAERLMQLIDLLKNGEGMSVKEMSKSLGVSSRTAYRYLYALSRMHFPLRYESGYFLDSSARLPVDELDADDRRLLSFCLRNNPLMSYPYFRKRFLRIEQQLSRVQRPFGSQDSKGLLVTENEDEAVRHKTTNDPLNRFVRAIRNGKKVTMTVRNSDTPLRGVTPVGIRLSKPGPMFLVKRARHDSPTEVPVSSVVLLAEDSVETSNDVR